MTTIYDIFVQKYGIIFNSQNERVISYFLFSALSGFVIGKIVSSRKFNQLLYKLHIDRTTNENIWDDVIRSCTWLRIYQKDGTSYLGQYRYGEPHKSDPVIVLETYQMIDADDDVVIDNSQDLSRAIVLNTKDFEKIEVIYSETKKSGIYRILGRFKSRIDKPTSRTLSKKANKDNTPKASDIDNMIKNISKK